MIRRITSSTVSPDAIQFPDKPVANCRLVKLGMLGADASARQISNGLAQLTCELQTPRGAERSMYFGLYSGSFDGRV